MKMVDSRIVRTLEDLRDFYFSIDYTPGERNVMVDLMSRMPVTEYLHISEVSDVEYLLL